MCSYVIRHFVALFGGYFSVFLGLFPIPSCPFSFNTKIQVRGGGGYSGRRVPTRQGRTPKPTPSEAEVAAAAEEMPLPCSGFGRGWGLTKTSAQAAVSKGWTGIVPPIGDYPSRGSSDNSFFKAVLSLLYYYYHHHHQYNHLSLFITITYYFCREKKFSCFLEAAETPSDGAIGWGSFCSSFGLQEGSRAHLPREMRRTQGDPPAQGPSWSPSGHPLSYCPGPAWGA